MKSIIQEQEDQCYICGYTQTLEKHHVWHGSANRKLADEDGLTVMLCGFCHRLLHDRGQNDRYLMEEGEKAWLRYTGKSIEEFIERYGKNVL